ncbi:MAG: class I SAM-dependent methyltransferase [Planctomycetaceae bacterium]
MMSDELFASAYDRAEITYGLEPSAELASYIEQIKPSGLAIDLGAGAGRNALALARAGLTVRAVDRSARGLERLRELAGAMALESRIEAVCADLREIELPAQSFAVVVATTVLDHIPLQDARQVWERIEKSLTDRGVVYAEVHTVEDPGCGDPPGCHCRYPVSETASAVKHYFAAGELLRLATASAALRVLRYEERQEWDYTHGPEHHHGKAVLLAVPAGYYPRWYGHPLAFPRRSNATSARTQHD